MGTYIRILTSSVASIGFGIFSAAQGSVSRSAEEQLLNPKPIELAVLKFDESEIEMPALSEDDAPYQVDFSYRNVSLRPLTITKIVTSCGCVSADVDSPIQVGAAGSGTDSGKISVAFNPEGYSGRVRKRVYVYTDISAEHPTSILSLSGKVTPSSDPWKCFPHEIGGLRAKQESMTFRVGNGIRKLAEAIAVINASNGKITPHVVGLPEYLSFRTIPESALPSQEMDLVFILDVDKIPNGHPDRIETVAHLNGIANRIAQGNDKVKIVIEFVN